VSASACARGFAGLNTGKGGWLSWLERLVYAESAMKAEVRQSQALLHFRQSHAHEIAHETSGFVDEWSGG
jgi:hypothetical protein